MPTFVALRLHTQFAGIRGDRPGRNSEECYHLVRWRSRRQKLRAADQGVVTVGEPDRQRAIWVWVHLGLDGATSQAQEPQVPLDIRPDWRSNEAHIPREELAPIVEEANPAEDECFSRTRRDVAAGTLIADRYAARQNSQRQRRGDRAP